MIRRTPLRLLAVTVLLALPACAAGEAARSPSPAPATSTAATSTAASPTAASPTEATKPHRVVGAGPDLVVPVPDGWHVLRSAHPVAGVAETSLCLLPPGRAVRSCAGIRIAWGPDLPGPRGAGDYAPGRHAGWYDGTETAQCPVGRATDVVVRRSDRLTASGTRLLGGHDAAWDRWHASCTDGSTFDPQVWFLEDEQVLARDLTGHAETPQVLHGARFREDGARIPAEATWDLVVAEEVRGTTLTVRAARVRGGRAVASGPPQRVDAAPAVCTGVLALPGDVAAPVVPCADLGRILSDDPDGALAVVVWREADGTVAQVSAQPWL